MKYILIALATFLCALFFVLPVHANTLDTTIFIDPDYGIYEIGSNNTTLVGSLEADPTTNIIEIYCENVDGGWDGVITLDTVDLAFDTSRPGVLYIRSTHDLIFQWTNAMPTSNKQYALWVSDLYPTTLGDYGGYPDGYLRVTTIDLGYSGLPMAQLLPDIHALGISIYNLQAFRNIIQHYPDMGNYSDARWQDGYDHGYDTGTKEKALGNAFSGILATVFSVFITLFDIDVLGINLLGLIATISALSVIIFVVKALRKN